MNQSRQPFHYLDGAAEGRGADGSGGEGMGGEGKCLKVFIESVVVLGIPQRGGPGTTTQCFLEYIIN